jgi:hypothetical protein
MDKTELLEALEDERQELVEMLEDLPDESLLASGVSGSWSIKDILIHLTHWEGQIVTLLYQVSQGMEKPSTAHFGKEKVDDLNQRWYEAGKERPLALVWQDWIAVRKQTLRRLNDFSEQDLNDPKRYPWLNNVALWQWIASDTFEHEEEHGDAIRDWLDKRDSSIQP